MFKFNKDDKVNIAVSLDCPYTQKDYPVLDFSAFIPKGHITFTSIGTILHTGVPLYYKTQDGFDETVYIIKLDEPVFIAQDLGLELNMQQLFVIMVPGRYLTKLELEPII